MSAASKLRRACREARITVFEKGLDVSYGACGLPYYISGENDDADLMRIRSAEQFRKQGIDVRLRHEVYGVDPTARIVAVRNLETGETFTAPYEKLVIATGASPIRPPLPGVDLPGVVTLKTIPDAEHIKEQLAQPDVEDVLIVGSGFIGLEMAEACVRLGKRVRVLEMQDRALPVYEPEISEWIAEALRRNGVALHTGEALVALEGQGRVRRARTQRGEYKADVVLLAVGVRPNTAFLRDVPGFRFLKNGAIVVNRRMETGVPDVWAGGDCATVEHMILQRPVYIPLGTNANKQGRLIGENLAGAQREFGGALGTSVVRVCDLEAGKTGVTEQEAREAGIPVKTAVVEVGSHARYYPGSEPIRIKVVMDRRTDRLIGACLAGKRGAALRTDVFATIISSGMRVQDAALLDLAYAPPFAQVWDAVHVAMSALTR